MGWRAKDNESGLGVLGGSVCGVTGGWGLRGGDWVGTVEDGEESMSFWLVAKDHPCEGLAGIASARVHYTL